MNLYSLPRATRQLRMTGRVLGGVLLAALVPISAITASAAGPIASSNFAGVENPLSENGAWVSLNSLALNGSRFQKSDGAFPTEPTGCTNVCNHGAARNTADVPADQYSEIVVGHVGSTSSNVGPLVRVQTGGPGVDSNYFWWASQPGGVNGLYRTDANGTGYTASLLMPTSGVVDGDRLRLIARGPVIYGIKNGVREFIYNPHLASWRYPTGATGILAFAGDGVVTNAKIASWSAGAAPASSGVSASTNFDGTQNPLDEGDLWYPLPSYEGFKKQDGQAVGRTPGHNATAAWGIAPPATQYSQVTLGTVSSASGGGPIVRIDRSAHGQTGWLLLLWAPDPGLSGIYKLSGDESGNPQFAAASLFPTAPTIVAGDAWGLAAEGNTLTVSKNGVDQFSYTTDGSYASGDVGFHTYLDFGITGWEGGQLTVADTEPPTAPSNLTATAVSGSQINLAWSASADNVGVTGYDIERCQGAGCSNFAKIATVTGTTYNNTGLTNASYSYRVRAADAAGNQSSYSNVASASTPDTQAPTAPTNLTATAASGTQINLAWTGSTDNVGVTGYQIERCQGAGCSNFAQIATVTGTTYSNTGLTGSTSYSYRVRAADAAGNQSTYSNVASASTPDTQAPTAPTNLTATAASGTQINLAWTGSTDNVGVTGYKIERCQGAGCSNFAQIATVTGTSYNNTGLTNATSYSYRVRATDAAGNQSPYSNVAWAATPDTQAPTAPSSLTATTKTSSRVDLAWTASTDNVGVTAYQIERCLGANCSNFTTLASVTGTTHSDTTVTADKIYRYRVGATDAAGNLSSYSNIASANTDTTKPTAPTALTALGTSSTQVNLLWTDATDNVGVTGYIIERSTGLGSTNFTQIATVTSGTSYTDSGRTPATVYNYRVRATDAAGNLGDYSNTATATTLAGGLGLGL
jgi:chitodextrinase